MNAILRDAFLELDLAQKSPTWDKIRCHLTGPSAISPPLKQRRPSEGLVHQSHILAIFIEFFLKNEDPDMQW